MSCRSAKNIRRWLLNVERLEHRQLLAADLVAHDHVEIVTWSPPSRAVSAGTQSATALSGKMDWESTLTQHASSLATSGQPQPTYRVTHAHYDADLGVDLVYLQQTLSGQDVVGANANFAIGQNGQISGYSSFVSTDLKTDAKPQFAATSPEMALSSLAKIFQWPSFSSTTLSRTTSAIGGKSFSAIDAPSVARAPVAFESVFVPQADGSLIPSWRLNVQVASSDSWLDASVSAVDGQVLFVADWTSDAQYQVFALPDENPNDGGRSILTDPQNASQSPFGWHDTNGVSGAESLLTTGNNTNAYRDTDANNVPDAGSSPSGGAALSFLPSLDLTQPPATSADASTVNLFYMTNVLHDVLANKGFNAASGNFQVNNYGAGGVGNDPLNAEDLDGSGTNNANMSTPPDGTSGRMQMYIWNGTTPNRSGSFDNGVIAHEFGHGVSNRLTGGPANSSALGALQSRGMGEGWSDYFGLAFTQSPTDTALEGRGIGTYVLGQPSSGLGIRSQRYSYDMSINTHTFADIIGDTSVHSIGETWATTLWDLHWALIGGSSLDSNLTAEGLGFNSNLNAASGGNNIALRLIVQALKLQPANPTFLQARDAILDADALLYGGTHQETIWRVFARRGMGLSATAGVSTATNVTAAFDLPMFGSIKFQREGLLGSGLSSVDGKILPVAVAGGERSLSFTEETGSKVSFVITPENPLATLSVRILRTSGSTVRGAATSPTPGAAVVIPPWSLSTGGDYNLVITADQPTKVRLQAARNAALESQIGDSNFDKELNINFTSPLLNLGSTNGVVGTSASGIRFTKTNNPSGFVDISTTGTPLSLADDAEISVVTTIGNSLLPAGNIVIGNNGGVLVGSSGDLALTNTDISTAPLGLFPFWDDIDADTGNVYWQQTFVDSVPTLVVQWNNRPHYSNIGSTTFQLQVFATGPVLARFAYADVDFGDVNYNGGASATIGVATAAQRAQFSFNSATLVAGDVIDITGGEDIDEFRFSGIAGQRVDVALDALAGASLGASFMRLLSETNAVLATATTKPLSTTTTVSNYDLGLVDYVLPATGNYSVRIYGRSQFNYYLTVTEALALDTENSTGLITPNHLLTLPGAMLGYVSPTDSRDLDDLQLTNGQTIRTTLTLVGEGAGMLPLNNLAPRLSIIRPSGASAAVTTSFNSAGEMILTYTAVETGRHRIDVRSVSGSGEYHVLVASVSGAPALAATAPIIESTKSSESSMPAWQNQIQPLDISGDERITALDALLLINELNSRRVSSADGRLPQQLLAAEKVDALYDANGDGLITSLDALLVINYLNK